MARQSKAERLESARMMATVGRGSNSGKELNNYIKRAEKLLREKQDVQDNISDLFKDAKDNGWDIKTMRRIIKLRSMTKEDREYEEGMVDVYSHAVGLIEAPVATEDEADGEI